MFRRRTRTVRRYLRKRKGTYRSRSGRVTMRKVAKKISIMRPVRLKTIETYSTTNAGAGGVTRFFGTTTWVPWITWTTQAIAPISIGTAENQMLGQECSIKKVELYISGMAANAPLTFPFQGVRWYIVRNNTVNEAWANVSPVAQPLTVYDPAYSIQLQTLGPLPPVKNKRKQWTILKRGIFRFRGASQYISSMIAATGGGPVPVAINGVPAVVPSTPQRGAIAMKRKITLRFRGKGNIVDGRGASSDADRKGELFLTLWDPNGPDPTAGINTTNVQMQVWSRVWFADARG